MKGKHRTAKKKKKWVLWLILACLAAAAVFGAVKLFCTPETEPEPPEKSMEKQPTQEQTDNPEIATRIESDYEHKLAAAALMGMTLDGDLDAFEVSSVLLTGSTPIEDKLQSQGIFIEYTCGSEQLCLYCRPLSEERTETETVDLFEPELGWATFEYVDGPEKAGLTVVTPEELGDELAQTALVTLSRH